MKSFLQSVLICGVILYVSTAFAAEQSNAAKIDDLRNRVVVLEGNVQTLQTGINDFSKTLVRNVDQ